MGIHARRSIRAAAGRTEHQQPPTEPTISLGVVTADVVDSTVSLQGSITTTGSVLFEGLNISIAENNPDYTFVLSTAIANGRTVTDETSVLSGSASLSAGEYVAYVSYRRNPQDAWTTGPKTAFTVESVPAETTIAPGGVDVSIANTSASFEGTITTTGSVTFDGLNISVAHDDQNFTFYQSTAFSNGQTVTDATFTLSGTIQNFTPGDYVAYVSYSLDGQTTWITGPKKKFTIVAPAPQAPNAPVASITDIQNTTARLSWSPPTQPNGAIASYTVGYRLAGTQSNLYRMTVGPSLRSFDFSNLTKNTAYEFWIYATNDSGQNSTNMIVAATTLSVPGGVLPTPDVVFYTGTNFSGRTISSDIGTIRSTLGGDNNVIQSIKIKPPAKVYAYSSEGFNGGVLVLTGGATNLSPYTYLGDRSFFNAISSYYVEAAAYEPPYVTGSQPIAVGDGSRVPVLAGSEKFSNVIIDSLQLQNQDTTTYNTFTSQVSGSTDSLRSIFSQALRNACAVLYSTADEVPMIHKNFIIRCANPAGMAQYAGVSIYPESTLEVYRGFSTYRGQSTWFIQHEMTHMISKISMRYYFENAAARALEEGVAEYVAMVAGLVTLPRPAGGGGSWQEGYRTTAYFFDYIERRVSPGFVRRLVASFTTTDLSKKVMPWSQNVVPSLNTAGKTLDQLWADYKAWVASGAPQLPLGASTAHHVSADPTGGCAMHARAHNE